VHCHTAFNKHTGEARKWFELLGLLLDEAAAAAIAACHVRFKTKPT
jgi:hypothetical protein